MQFLHPKSVINLCPKLRFFYVEFLVQASIKVFLKPSLETVVQTLFKPSNQRQREAQIEDPSYLQHSRFP